MDETKAWYESTSIWGSVVAGLCFVLNWMFGVTIDEATQKVIINHLASAITTFGALAGIGASIYGRVKATKQIAPAKPA